MYLFSSSLGWTTEKKSVTSDKIFYSLTGNELLLLVYTGNGLQSFITPLKKKIIEYRMFSTYIY